MALAVVGLNSCDYDGDDDAYVTHYVTFELTGGSQYLVPVGTAYEEPGFTATEGDENVNSKVVIGGDEVDGNQIGVYNVTYSAVNKDGFSASTERTVIVYNPDITTDIAGTYTVAAGTYRQRGSTQTSYSGYEIPVTKIAPGVFYVSDFLGGYYWQRAGYGTNYAMQGYVSLNADNTIDILSGDVAGWGDSYSDFTDGKYDPDTKTISFVVTYAGMDFHVIMSL